MGCIWNHQLRFWALDTLEYTRVRLKNTPSELVAIINHIIITLIKSTEEFCSSLEHWYRIGQVFLKILTNSKSYVSKA